MATEATARILAWDTCVFMDAIPFDHSAKPAGWTDDEFEKRKQENVDAASIYQDARKKKLLIVGSWIVLAEFVRPRDADASEQSDRRIEQFLRRSEFEFRNADHEVSAKARDLQRSFKMQPIDAIHLATAVLVDAEALLTRDGKRKALLPLDRAVDTAKGKLRVMTPSQWVRAEQDKEFVLGKAATPSDAKTSEPALPASQLSTAP